MASAIANASAEDAVHTKIERNRFRPIELIQANIGKQTNKFCPTESWYMSALEVLGP